MTNPLPSDVQAVIQAKVASGEFASEAAVVAAGIRLLEREDAERNRQTEKLRGMLQEAIQQIERGEHRDGEEVFAEVLRELGDDEADAT